MKTKVAKSDFNEINLPKTRFKQFGDIFIHEWRTLLLCSLVLFIFAIPYIVKLIFEYIILTGVSGTLDPNLSDMEKAATLISYQNVFNLISIPCFMIFSISISGIMRVFKELCFGNGTYFKLDFSRGIKENVVITLILSFIFSLLIFLVKYSFNTLYLTNMDYNVLTLLRGIGYGIIFALIVPLFLFNLSQYQYYSLPFYQNAINSFRFMIHRYFIVIIFALFSFAIFMVTLINNRLIAAIFIALIIIFIIPLYILVWHLYSLSFFDKNINKNNYPEIYRKGLSKE